ncbi:hypothetical protein RJ639_033630 [Escallonia herrerae]|uniref:Autophagy-related protein n=1 Tax=Escallonia herrerae TaxID=1293975 RepID=A0AA88X2C0_9ASTE|nr:hypothetical protein RJ639_033630 [Escallonia herrerae]
MRRYQLHNKTGTISISNFSWPQGLGNLGHCTGSLLYLLGHVHDCCGLVARVAKFDIYLFYNRYLVPRDMSVGQFIHILSSRLHLAPGKALFVFVKNTLPQTSSLMEVVYESFKDDDGFLYMCYSSEKTFGKV